MSGKQKGAAKVVAQAMQKLYFCGYDLKSVANHSLLIMLQSHVKHGLCFEASGLAMMILRNNRTAQLNRGYTDLMQGGGRGIHAWTEFIDCGNRYVLDLCHGPIPVLARDYERYSGLKPDWSCNYHEFWQHPAAEFLYENYRRKETSFLLEELIMFRPLFETVGFKTDFFRDGFDAYLANADPRRLEPTTLSQNSACSITQEMIDKIMKIPCQDFTQISQWRLDALTARTSRETLQTT